MIKLRKTSHDGVISRMEEDIVNLQNEQIELLRKKLHLESELREYKEKNKRLESEGMASKEKAGLWKKASLVIGATVAVLFSFFSSEGRAK